MAAREIKELSEFSLKETGEMGLYSLEKKKLSDLIHKMLKGMEGTDASRLFELVSCAVTLGTSYSLRRI